MGYTLSDFIEEWNGVEPYIKAHTSGSTGAPKEIHLLKSDMMASARATNGFFGISSASVLALPLSLEYIAGKMMAVRSLIAGCRLEIIRPENAFPFEGEADLISVVPTQVQNLLAHLQWAKSMRNVLIGGGALSPSDRAALIDAGYHGYVSYGMTETCSHVALMDIASGSDAYHAMPGITFDIDERGCLVVIAKNFSFGRLVTNDVVDLVNDRSFVWRGRFDNVINSGGIKLHPEVLEHMFSSVVGYPFYIVGEPDKKWGECVAMVVACSDDDLLTIKKKMAESFDHRYIPKNYYRVGCLPTTASGKVRRVAPDKL